MLNEENEVIDETSEETQEEVETVEESADDSVESETPTLDDYERLKKENQTLKAQKEHFKKKATEIKINKSNESVGLSREEAILIAKGTDERVLEEAKLIADTKKIPLKEALEYPTVKAYGEQLKAEERRAKAQLGASGGSGSGGNEGDLTQKVGMSREEHKKALGF